MEAIPKTNVLKTIENEYAKNMNVALAYIDDDKDALGILIPFKGDNKLLVAIRSDEQGFLISTVAKGTIEDEGALNATLPRINELNSRFKRGHFYITKESGLIFETFLHCSDEGSVPSTDLFKELKLGYQMFELHVDEIAQIIKENMTADEYVIKE